jgi:DNA-binding GntR family transcriptional regulator
MVYQKLKEDINTGILEQGERIVAREIAKQLGVSDIPVREALKKLESEGLVENVPHVGSRVSTINIQQAREVFAIRLELESYATRLAALNANDEEIDKLQEIVDCIEQAIQTGDVKEISSLNTNFHQLLYQLSRNETLCELILSLMDRSAFSKSVFTYIPDRKEHSNKEHQLIVDALRKRDSEGAEKALRGQKEYSFATLLEVLAQEKERKKN